MAYLVHHNSLDWDLVAPSMHIIRLTENHLSLRLVLGSLVTVWVVRGSFGEMPLALIMVPHAWHTGCLLPRWPIGDALLSQAPLHSAQLQQLLCMHAYFV